MLLAFMYHHINAPAFSNSEPMFRRHVEHLLTHCNVVVPGEALSAEKMNVCLSFDDAGVDFFYYVYPILEAYRLKAVLAVPAGRIQNSTDMQREERLSFSPLTPIHERRSDHFCTWQELHQMSSSGLVHIASHGMTHNNLLTTTTYEREIKESKQLLDEKLQIHVQSFVFPYGMFNAQILNAAKKHYTYLFGVGSVSHTSWEGTEGIIYRIPNDDINAPSSMLSLPRLIRYKANTPKIKLKTWLMKRKRFQINA